MSRNKKTELFYKVLVTLIWPFAGLLILFTIGNLKNNKYLYLLIAFIFGYYTMYTEDMDLARHVNSFLDISAYDHNLFFASIFNYDKFKDFYLLILSYIISRFTCNPKVFIGFLSFCYFFLLIEILNIINHNKEKNQLILSKYYFAIIILFIPISAYGQARFWTAAFLFVLCILNIVLKDKKSYIFIAFLSIFIHYSFLIPCLFLIITILIIDNNLYCYLLLTVSGIFKGIIQYIFPKVNKFSSLINHSFNEYSKSSIDTMNNVGNFSWFIQVRFSIYILLVIALIILISININTNIYLKKLQNCLIIIFSMVLLVSDEAQSFIRFNTLFSFLAIIYLYLLNINNPNCKLLNTILCILIIPLSIVVILGIRYTLQTVSWKMLLPLPETSLINNACDIWDLLH